MPSMTLTCRICNLPMQRSRTSQPQGQAAHNACRSGGAAAPSTHGASGYRYGCRCDECRYGQAARMATYAKSCREKTGVHPTTIYRRAFREANGYWPNARGSDWIHPKLRRELYERDDWTCYVCLERLDAGTPVNEPDALTLDHIVPRSKGGSDHPENLKTCCRGCNVRKSDSIPVGILTA